MNGYLQGTTAILSELAEDNSSRYSFSIFFVLEHSTIILELKMEHCYCVVCLQNIYLRKCLWELKSAKYFKKK